ncbi:MAG: glycosyltransferase [Solirubrobacterales bacterium]
MKVLLTTRGSAGHLGPLAPFAHACMRAGHKVLVAAQRQNEANVTRAGLEFAPVDDPPEEEWMPLMGRFAELDIATANDLMISKFFAGIDLRAELAGLREIVESRRPDVILRESWEFGSTLVAEYYEIPIVRVGLALAGVEELTVQLAAEEVDEARRLMALPEDPAGQRLRDSPYFTTMPEALEDPAAVVPERTHRFRFGASEAAGPLPGWWPGNDDPLVYVTFGSVAAGAHLPFYPELYRAAVDALALLPARILVTVGDATRDLAELGELPPNVHVEIWVPHDDVAARADVIVCHGGYGSTLGALAHGAPLVVLPLFSTDQLANGEAAARAGAGFCLDAGWDTRSALGLPTVEAIEALHGAVERVLDDPAYRLRAQRVAESMRKLPPIDSSVEVLEEIVAGPR